jgi:Tfp pilus assembly protein PilF
LALIVVCLSLAGCATAGKIKPKPVEPAPPAAVAAPVAPPPAVAASPSVMRLADGREGFVITEPPTLDAEARADFERAVALMGEGDGARAIPLLEKVIERAPGLTAPHINLAIALRRAEKPEAAEEQLKTALALVPGHPVASNEYGLLLRQAGRFAEARGVYEQALAAFPDYLPARRNLGILCDLYLNDLACALEQYERYSLAMPQDEQVKMWVADLTARLSR